MTPATRCRRLATMLGAKAEPGIGTLRSEPNGSASHEAILFWLINLSGMALRKLSTRPSREVVTSMKKWPDVFSQGALNHVCARR
jgi:hypothetical protein